MAAPVAGIRFSEFEVLWPHMASVLRERIREFFMNMEDEPFSEDMVSEELSETWIFEDPPGRFVAVGSPKSPWDSSPLVFDPDVDSWLLEEGLMVTGTTKESSEILRKPFCGRED